MTARLMTLLPALLLVADPPTTVAQGQDAAAVIGRASRIYRNLSSFQADFTQVIQDRSQGDTLTTRGTLIQAGPNLFAMRFTDPPGEAIVMDGTYIWTYTPSTAPNQVYRNRLTTDPVYGENFLAVLLDRPYERYRAALLTGDMVAGKRVDVVELTPISESIPFLKARLWLGGDDGLPRRVELDEAPGFRRSIVLERLQPNAPYTRRTFTFEVPPGVRVISQG